MARVCQLFGKKSSSGKNRPFSLKSTKRVFRPNLFYKRVFNPETGRVERMRLSAKAIRTLKKWTREIEEEMAAKNPVVATEADEGAERSKHVKKEKLTPKQKKEIAAAKAAEFKNTPNPVAPDKKEVAEKKEAPKAKKAPAKKKE